MCLVKMAGQKHNSLRSRPHPSVRHPCSNICLPPLQLDAALCCLLILHLNWNSVVGFLRIVLTEFAPSLGFFMPCMARIISSASLFDILTLLSFGKGIVIKELSPDHTWRECNNFPSWSWASAPDSCGKCDRLDYEDFTAVASWAFVNKDGNSEPIFAVSRDYTVGFPGNLTPAVLAWDAGCMPTTKPCPIPLPTRHHKDYDGKENEQAKGTWLELYYSPSLRKRWSTYEEFWLESRGCGDPPQWHSANSSSSLSKHGASENIAICDQPSLSPEYMSHFSAQHVALASSTGPGRRLLCYTQMLDLTISAPPKTTTLPTALCSLPKSTDIHTIHHSSSTRPIGIIRLPPETWGALRDHDSQNSFSDGVIHFPFLALSVSALSKFRDLNEFDKWFDLGIMGNDTGSLEETTTWGPDRKGQWFGQDPTGERLEGSVVLLRDDGGGEPGGEGCVQESRNRRSAVGEVGEG